MARRRGGTRRYRGRARTRPYGTSVNGPPIEVTIPVPVNARFRTVEYRYPEQIQRARRVVRRSLRTLPVRYVLRTVRVLGTPRIPPSVRGSYVTLDRYGRLNIHSRKQWKGVMVTELDRRRYLEGKKNYKKHSHGQLDSRGADYLGIVAAAHKMGLSNERIMDAAMVARSLRYGRR